MGGKPSSAGDWSSGLKGLTASICSYIISVLRFTTTAAWRSSGTCVVPGFILQFPHFSRQASDLSLGGIWHENTHLLTQRYQQDTERDKYIRSLSWATCGSVQTFQACTNVQDKAIYVNQHQETQRENTLEGLGIKLSYWKRTGLLSFQHHVWKFMY